MLQIQNKLMEYGKLHVQEHSVREVRLGLGYSCVELNNGNMGIAWTAEDRACTCTQLGCAGSMAGMAVSDALAMLTAKYALERTVGLATLNALNHDIQRNCHDRDILSLINIQADEHVVMVGYFGPLLPAIKNTGCKFEIAELKPDQPGTISSEAGLNALQKCNVAIITATSIINGTCDAILTALEHAHRGGQLREAVVLGPSTPMCPEIFAGTGITRLSGAYVVDGGSVKTIISEGGGTKLLKKYLRFTTVNVE